MRRNQRLLLAGANVLKELEVVRLGAGRAEIPMWASVLGVVVPGALALWLWREERS